METHWCAQSEKFRPPETTERVRRDTRLSCCGGQRSVAAWAEGMEWLAAAILGSVLQKRELCQADLVRMPACLLLATKCCESVLTSEVQFPKYLKSQLQRIVCGLPEAALPSLVGCYAPVLGPHGVPRSEALGTCRSGSAPRLRPAWDSCSAWCRKCLRWGSGGRQARLPISPSFHCFKWPENRFLGRGQRGVWAVGGLGAVLRTPLHRCTAPCPRCSSST